MRIALIACPLLLLILAAARGEQPSAPPVAASELKQYVDKPDSSYRYEKRREGKIGEGTFAELILTSQTWHDIVWKHQLLIIKPKEVTPGAGAIMLIDGGRWRGDLEKASSSSEPPPELIPLAALAEKLKSPVVVLRHVPFQPIFGGMIEDQIIAYTFEQYVRTGDATWPLLLPMTKSAVRGMDAAQSYAKDAWKLDIEHFTLTGASKRGWTTWLASAVDPRVTALSPMVIDTLNMGPQTLHQMQTWGKMSEQLDDYTNRGLQRLALSPGGIKLIGIVDPYSYRDQIKQPKLILLGTNDRYWPLDALNLYYPALEGEKHILYVPNNGHGLRDFERVYGTISALHRHASGEMELPKLTWDRADSADRLQLSMKSDVRPTLAQGWMATSPTKDFRDAKWTSFPTKEVDGSFRCEQPTPKTGYMAMFGEARYEQNGVPYFFSTTVQITEAGKSQ